MIDHSELDTDDDGYDYDRVTARDIAEFLYYHAQMRCGPGGDDPASRAAFLRRKAELFSRIAEQAARTRVDAYVEQVRQLATDARTAADQFDDLQLPHQRVGPDQRRTSDHPPHPGGANSEENTGASSGDLAHIA